MTNIPKKVYIKHANNDHSSDPKVVTTVDMWWLFTAVILNRRDSEAFLPGLEKFLNL
jgi:hypothetical protein